MEAAAFARQRLRQHQHAGARVVAAQRAVQGLHGNGQSMRPPQAFGDGVVHLRRRGAHLGGDRLGRRFERWEVVAAIVEQVACLLVGQQHAAPGGQGDAAGILARHAPGAIQRQHRVRGIRCNDGKLGHFRLRHRIGREQRIGECLAQRDLKLALRTAGQGGKVHAQRLAKLDQQRCSHRALIVLDQVQIAGRDAQAYRQRLLGQATFGA